MEIEIHVEKNYAWCEINGTFIYGKNKDEIGAALDVVAAKLRPWLGYSN